MRYINPIAKGVAKPMKHRELLCGVPILLALGAGCIKLTTENEIKPIEVKPIHITVDINVKIDRALDDFFGDLDNARNDEKK